MADNPSVTTAPPAAPDRSELGSLIRLALPLIAGHAGGQLMSFVDTAMVGRLGPAALGGVGIGSGIFFAITVIGMGSVLGMDPLVAQAVGAGELDRARRILWQGVRVGLLMSVPLMALIVGAALSLEHLGVESETANEARRFMFGRLANVTPFLLFSAMRSYLQATGGARFVVWGMVAANIVNVIGNVLFIYGDSGLVRLGLPAVGLPSLGVFGSGIASSIASIASISVVILGVRATATPPDPERRAWSPELFRKILKLGWPIGLQLLAEVGAFAVISILSGRIGKSDAAGYQIAITLASLTFTFMLGLSSATAVRVGQAVGRGDTPGARLAGFTAIRASLVFMSFTAVAFITAPEVFARILTDKLDVIAAAAPLVQVSGFFQLSDGAQVVASGALRGAGDTKTTQLANLIGYYVIGLPIAVGLAFGFGMGGPGLFWGLSAGLTVVAVALSFQFNRISKKKLERV